LEAHGQAAVLTDGIASVLPRSLTMRPFSPALAPTILKLGLPAVCPSVHAERFAQLMREESARAQSGSRSAYARL